MTQIQIWHHPEGDFLARDPRPFPGAHWLHVADVTVDAPDVTAQLAQAFELSNHNMADGDPLTSWTGRPEVTFLHRQGARSTSVGDVLVLGTQAWRVQMVGFSPLPTPGRWRVQMVGFSPLPTPGR